MGIFLDIEAALQTKLAAISGAPDIDWENAKVYTPVIGTKFWRPTHLPAHSELVSADALQKHQGIYQIDVFVPLNTGLAVMSADLDAIYTAFNSTLSLTSGIARVDILSVGRGRIVREESWCHGFIQIEYMCYAQ